MIIPIRLARQVEPYSQLSSPVALCEQIGLLATSIMFHPDVKSQSAHSHATIRRAMLEVRLVEDVWSHDFCLSETIVWTKVYATVAKAWSP